LGQRRNGSEQHLFIKFACTSFAQIERITRIWPHVPWIFLYRDPVETVVSNINDPPTWLLDDDWRVLASIIGVSPGEVAAMSLEERCARSIGSFYSHAVALANDNSMLLNYNELSISSVLEAIARTREIYSKEVSGTRPFVADADAKQKLASDLIRKATAAWSNEAYQRLEQKRLRQ
jgi:hypothetical protein